MGRILELKQQWLLSRMLFLPTLVVNKERINWLAKPIVVIDIQIYYYHQYLLQRGKAGIERGIKGLGSLLCLNVLWYWM